MYLNPVTQSLPAPLEVSARFSDFVLTLDEDGNYRRGCYNFYERGWVIPTTKAFEDTKVQPNGITHWASLPPIPHGHPSLG